MLVGRPSDHRSGRRSALALALAVPLLGAPLLGACAEPPSFLLSWELDDGQVEEDEAPALSPVEQCSMVGVSTVRITTMVGACVETKDADDNLVREFEGVDVDTRVYPCSAANISENFAVEGPALEPGEYMVLVEGLRRTGEPWACDYNICEFDPVTAPCIARALTTVTVAEDSQPVRAVTLASPPQCDDGVDNDRDGRVDGHDPACILDPTGAESTDATVAVFLPTVSFLGVAPGSSVIKPFNLGVDALLLEVDGEQLAVIPDYQLDLSESPYALPLLLRSFEADTEHELSITAVRGALGGDLVPLTQPVSHGFEILGNGTAYVDDEFSFTSDVFLEPIVQPIAFNTSLLLAPDDTTGPGCELGGFVGNQPITIERTWVRVTDADNQPLDAATLGLGGFAAAGGQITPVDEPDGWVSFECASSTVSSAALTWGAYDIEVEGRIGGDSCFVTPMISQLAPQPSSAQEFKLERVLVNDVPPVACQECTVNNDCSNQVCVNFVCVDKDPSTNG